MSQTNDINKVLVVDGTKAIPAAGGTIAALTDGQLGVFDASTHLAIDGTTLSKNFYLAVGRGTPVSGAIPDIEVSSGQDIIRTSINQYNFRPHTPGRTQVQSFTLSSVQCDTDYGLKMEFQNGQTLRRLGHIGMTQTFMVRSEDCEECANCSNIDPNKVLWDLMQNIQKNASDFVTVTAHVAATDAVILDADVPAYITTNAAVNTDDNTGNNIIMELRFTGVPAPSVATDTINLNYYRNRETLIIISTLGATTHVSTIVEEVSMVQPEGLGYDVRQLEYRNAGNEAGPYRVSSVLPVAKVLSLKAAADGEYDQIWLGYEGEHRVNDFIANQSTLIAIPAAVQTCIDSLVIVLDRLCVPLGFEEKASDVTAAVADVTTVETTSSKTASTDGLD